MRKIAVYGSLLTKLHNHRVLGRHIERGGVRLIGTDALNIPYKMFDLGCYPGLISSEKQNENIFVEVYEIDDQANVDVEGLEGYQGEEFKSRNYYNKAIVESKFGDVEIYVFNIESYEGMENQEIKPVDNVVNWKDYYLNLDNKF